jgi:hypothetical protein
MESGRQIAGGSGGLAEKLAFSSELHCSCMCVCVRVCLQAIRGYSYFTVHEHCSSSASYQTLIPADVVHGRLSAAEKACALHVATERQVNSPAEDAIRAVLLPASVAVCVLRRDPLIPVSLAVCTLGPTVASPRTTDIGCSCPFWRRN